MCESGKKYVLKRAGLQRTLVAEHVVARLGLRIGAPCFDVCFATVPLELIKAEPKLTRFATGPAHASAFIDGLAEVRGIAHENHPLNRTRFASLHVLYSWTFASDHQFMYELAPPNLVYSHDHGLFFAGRKNWSITTLEAAHVAQLDTYLGSLKFTAAELQASRQELQDVAETEIAEVISTIPAAWGVPEADLLALQVYLCARRESLLEILPTA